MAFFDEMRGRTGEIRPPYRQLAAWLEAMPAEALRQKRAAADLLFRRLGITFTVYGESAGTERPIPFDIVPRVISAAEWQSLSDGLVQRVRALNAFLHDIYHDQDILRAGRIPPELILLNSQYRPEMRGVDVPGGVYVHIVGTDLIRTGEGQAYVLEDNARTPSGVSYMLENRSVMMRLFPDLFARHRIARIDHYPDELLRSLRSTAPDRVEDPTVVVLTPGPANSAYFEHAYLAEQMGVELVQGHDLFVRDDAVYMRTTEGPRRVDVIYRRIDDDFLDPLAFHPGSMLGVPGLLSVYASGNVTLANAVGTGVADDKSIYPLMPDIIRFYLAEEPLLPNVPTYNLRDPGDLAYTLDHLHELVVKEVHGSGGYGMLVGPASTAAERSAFRDKILAQPAGFIAQPTLALSTCPTFADAGADRSGDRGGDRGAGQRLAGRHVDLRPFVLTGRGSVTVVPGGLTRVALREGSLVVNSSQGGGTKDTWVLEPDGRPDEQRADE